MLSSQTTPAPKIFISHLACRKVHPIIASLELRLSASLPSERRILRTADLKK
jgi:hypothetical protein